MSKPNDNPADPFKKALAEASKVMANDPELNVTYSVDPSGLSGDSMRLPQVSRRMTREEVLLEDVMQTGQDKPKNVRYLELKA